MADELDLYRRIARDADGNPIFFVLPPAMEASYGRKLRRCEAGWRATGDPAFVIEAVILSYLHRQPLRLWQTEAMVTLATKRRTKGYATSALKAAIRLLRYQAVLKAKRRRARSGRPTPWDDAYEQAAEVLAGTGAAAKAATMKKAYCDVVDHIKTGRGGLYANPIMPRRKLGDALRPAASPRRRSKRRSIT
jgi:hypothetical protein